MCQVAVNTSLAITQYADTGGGPFDGEGANLSWLHNSHSGTFGGLGAKLPLLSLLGPSTSFVCQVAVNTGLARIQFADTGGGAFDGLGAELPWLPIFLKMGQHGGWMTAMPLT